jgi:hypothetical protein
MRALFVAALLCGPAGCVWTVDASDVRDSNREAMLHFDRQIVLTGPFLARARRGRLGLAQRRALRTMESCVERFRRLRARMARLSARFDRVAGKRGRITSADPEWSEVERLRAEYGRIKASADQTVEELRQAAITYLEAG